jgi:hypothetical protein
VIRNLTGKRWTVFPEGEEAKTVEPGQRLGVRPMTIDFPGTRGRVVCDDGPSVEPNQPAKQQPVSP